MVGVGVMVGVRVARREVVEVGLKSIVLVALAGRLAVGEGSYAREVGLGPKVGELSTGMAVGGADWVSSGARTGDGVISACSPA